MHQPTEFFMTNPIDLGFARSAHRMVKHADEALGLMTRSEQRQLSLVDIIQGLKDHQRVSGFAAEALQERARIRGDDFDPRCPTVPWSILEVETRAPLAAGLGGVGGAYLVDTVNEPTLIDILRPRSLAVQSGATVYDGLDANAIFPRLAADVTGQWLTSESTSATEQPPLFGAAAVTPKTWGFTCRWSRQLQQQAPNIEAFLRTIAARAAGQALDTAALNGSGISGVPLGLLNVGGLPTQGGAAYTHANSWTTRGTLAAANVDDASIAWLGAPGVRTILAARERAAGDEYIWGSNDQITGRRAGVSTVVPAGTLIAGDFSSLAFCFFGDGFQIDSTGFNTAADFQAGIMAMRLLVSVDIFLQHTPSFVAVTSVS
jgi:HK97 family phage major capsid protein